MTSKTKRAVYYYVIGFLWEAIETMQKLCVFIYLDFPHINFEIKLKYKQNIV